MRSRPVITLFRSAAALILSLGCAFTAAAHDSPEHAIERLTAVMARDGKSPRRLFERATEYRAWGQLDLAQADLEEAIRLDPDMVSARLDLSRLLLSLGQVASALEASQLALAHAPDPAAQSPLHMVRAQILLARFDYAGALAECDLAWRNPPAELDWYLTRSRIELYLGRHEARVQGLKTGRELTGSFVLEMEWIEALLDGGRCDEALRSIEPQLQSVRWQSSWLIRRARARLGLGQAGEAHRDLRAALAEIGQRLDPERPDLSLCADRGIAWALLGETDKAREALCELQRREAGEDLTWRLEWMLNQGRGERP